MAAGDEAAAAGLSVVPATADVRQGYASINVRGDELARHMTSGTHPFYRITGQIGFSQIPNNFITNAKLAVGAALANLAPGSITNAYLAAGAALANLAPRSISRALLAKGYSAGIVSSLGPGPAGVYVAHGLSGNVVMTVTSRGVGGGLFYAAQPDPDRPTTHFWIRAWGDGDAGPIQWTAVEV